MNLKQVISNIIPNPFSDKSSLPDLEKKIELLSGGIGLSAAIKNIVFLSVISFIVLRAVSDFPINIFVILFGAEILANIVQVCLNINKVKIIYALDTKDVARSYWEVIRIREYFYFLASISGFLISLAGLLLLLALFSSEISEFIKIIPEQLNWLKYILSFFVVCKFFDLAVKLVRYRLVKNLKINVDLAQIDKEYLLINKKLGLLNFIPMMAFAIIIFLIFLLFFGVPKNFIFLLALFLIGPMVLMISLSIIELKRIGRVSFSNPAANIEVNQMSGQTTEKAAKNSVIVEIEDEKITGAVFGIIRAAAGIKDIFKPNSSAVLGVGVDYYPENSIFISQYRFLLAQIPMTGGNKVLGDTDYTMRNFFFNREEIKRKGEELLNGGLPAILPLTAKEILYQDIKRLTLKKNKIIIEKNTGEKISYGFLNKDYNDLLRQQLPAYLGEKLSF